MFDCASETIIDCSYRGASFFGYGSLFKFLDKTKRFNELRQPQRVYGVRPVAIVQCGLSDIGRLSQPPVDERRVKSRLFDMAVEYEVSIIKFFSRLLRSNVKKRNDNTISPQIKANNVSHEARRGGDCLRHHASSGRGQSFSAAL